MKEPLPLEEQISMCTHSRKISRAQSSRVIFARRNAQSSSSSCLYCLMILLRFLAKNPVQITNIKKKGIKNPSSSEAKWFPSTLVISTSISILRLEGAFPWNLSSQSISMKKYDRLLQTYVIPISTVSLHPFPSFGSHISLYPLRALIFSLQVSSS